MKIVIDIPYGCYEELRNGRFPLQDAYRLVTLIRLGTPLPKHHGRLIDADAIPRHLVRDIDEIDKQPTIIEGSDSECQE